MDALRQIDPVVLGERVRVTRRAKGLTQAQLAGTDVTISYVSRIEAGQRRPEPRVLDALARRLDVSADELLLGVPDRDAESARLGLDFAELALETGDAAEALRRVDELLAGTATRSVAWHTRARTLRARALEATGRLDAAIEALEALLADEPGGVHALSCGIALSRCYREAGDLTQAVTTGEALLAQVAGWGLADGDEAVQLGVTVAAAYFQRGDTHFAVRMCRDLVAAAENRGSPFARAAAYWNASVMELETGSAPAAVALAGKALALLGEGKDARNLGRLRSQLGIMQLMLDPPEVDEAAANLHAAARALEASGTRVDRLRNDVGLARTRLMSGEVGRARDEAAAVFEAARDIAPLLAADARALEGQAAAAAGDIETAKARFKEAVFVLTGVGDDRSAAQLWLELGGLLESVGETATASEAYRSAAVASGLRARSTLPAHVHPRGA